MKTQNSLIANYVRVDHRKKNDMRNDLKHKQKGQESASSVNTRKTFRVKPRFPHTPLI